MVNRVTDDKFSNESTIYFHEQSRILELGGSGHSVSESPKGWSHDVYLPVRNAMSAAGVLDVRSRPKSPENAAQIDFAKTIKWLSGPTFSTTKIPKQPTKLYLTRVLEKTRGAFLYSGCPLKHTLNWLAQNNNLKITASLHTPLQTLLYLDFDCHDGKGSIRDALKLLDLIQHILPTAQTFITPRGVGAWVLVQHQEPVADSNINRQYCDAKKWNALIDDMQSFVRAVAAANNLDLSSVEVHGKVIDYDLQPWVMVNQCPMLFKCPPGEQYVPSEPVMWSTLYATDWTPPKAAPKAKAVLRAGSRLRHTITDAQLATVPALAREIVAVYFPNREIRIRTGTNKITTRLVTDIRFAEYMLVICDSKPNKDGSMPYAMHKAQIEELYALGKISHGWSHDVYRHVRNAMADAGFLEVQDGGKYTPPLRDGSGNKVQDGKACRWQVVQWFRDYVTNFTVSIWSDLPADAGQDSHPTAEPAGMAIKSFGAEPSEIKKPSELTKLESPPFGSHSLLAYICDPWRPTPEYTIPAEKRSAEQVYAGLLEIGLAF